MDKKLLTRIFLSAVLLFAAWMVTRSFVMPVWAQLLVYLVPYLLISYDVMGEAVEEGIKERNPFNEDFLMCVATIGALLIGFLPGAEPQFPEAVFVMLFFQVGELFEDFAEDRSRHAVKALMDIRPDTANVERGGAVSVVDPNDVKPGEIVVIRPGERVPMDGTIIEGASSLNTVALTGESVPRSVGVGDEALSGCVNVSGVLKVRVTKSFGDSTASKIIKLVEESSENKSKSETFIRRFSRVYTPIVVFLGIAVAFVPPLFCDSYEQGLVTWIYRALSFLVVSCPCALVISVPLSFFGGIGGASRKGILIKGGNYMDALVKLSTVVFDKTGTLTKGVFMVTAVHPETIGTKDLLHLAAHAENYSTHPIASALRAAFSEEPFEDVKFNDKGAARSGDTLADGCHLEDVEEIAGKGIRATEMQAHRRHYHPCGRGRCLCRTYHHRRQGERRQPGGRCSLEAAWGGQDRDAHGRPRARSRQCGGEPGHRRISRGTDASGQGGSGGASPQGEAGRKDLGLRRRRHQRRAGPGPG